MGEIIDLIAKVKKYYRFSRPELKGIIITVIVFAFVISFRDWGQDQINIFTGLSNFLYSILIVST